MRALAAAGGLAVALAGCIIEKKVPRPTADAGPGGDPSCGDAGAPVPHEEGGCVVPDGTYLLVLVPISGDCPDELVEQPGATWFAGLDRLELFGVACGPIESSAATEEPALGCDLTLTYDLEGTATGILEGGAAILDATCDDGTMCRHIFEVVIAGACAP